MNILEYLLNIFSRDIIKDKLIMYDVYYCIDIIVQVVWKLRESMKSILSNKFIKEDTFIFF